LLREIANVELLSDNLERERSLYTRIGLPFYDLTKLFSNGGDIKEQIYQHIKKEYQAVRENIREIDIRAWFEQLKDIRKLIGEGEE
jgi:hypothetical protein